MELSRKEHRAWAEIDLDALCYNYGKARGAAPGSEVLCVVKADAYGHGAVPAVRALKAAGARRFAVATAEEALQLRGHRVAEPLLLLGMAPARWAPVMARQRVAMAVGSLECARAYSAALNGETLNIHLKLDSGMRRIGLWGADTVQDALEIAQLPGLAVEGIFTHFASADEAVHDDFTALQLRRFIGAADALAAQGLRAPLRHAANSAAIIAHPAAHLQMIRPGILLYGGNPRADTAFALRQPLSLKARVVQVKELDAGETVSYGRTWAAPGKVRVATLGIGYADGLLRALSGNMQALVGGRKVPQVGRICMDMCMLNVSGVPGVQPGDVATLIGADGSARITADEVAAQAGTISYELLCAVGRRVPRLYIQGGKPVEETCIIGEGEAL